ncbi:transcription initiation factor TFIID subunit 1-like [Styela clava]
MSSSDSENDGGGTTDFTGFLFGNIDEHGHLENDIFEEELKSHLSQLNALTGIGNFVKEFEDKDRISQEGDLKYPLKIGTLPDAVDYSTINELADDDDDETVSANISSIQSGEESMLFDSGSVGSKFHSTFHPVKGANSRKSGETKTAFGSDIILPSIVSHPSGLDDGQKHFLESARHEKSSGKKVKKHKFEKKKKKKDRHSAQQQMSEEEIAFENQMKEINTKVQSANIKDLFPEFRSGEVLRFLRLFGPGKTSSMPNRWRNCRKRRKKKRIDGNQDEITTQNIHKDETISKTSDILMPEPSECLTDDEVKMMKPQKITSRVETKKKSSATAAEIPAWRYGPAALWYDMLGISETGEGFDYGFKLKPQNNAETESRSLAQIPGPSAEHFYMVSQVKWEDDIIWNADDIINKMGNKNLPVSTEFDDRHKVRVNKAAQAGWVPTSTQRTALPNDSTAARSPLAFPTTEKLKNEESSPPKKKIFNSIFPIDNYELIYGDWEKDIIWDDQNMDFIPKPKVFQLNPNDENIILGLPEEPKSYSTIDEKESKKEKKAKIILGKSAAKDEDEETQEKTESKLDHWNLSNDEFYDPRKSSGNKLAVNLVGALQHSIPALELQQPFFPTHMSAVKLHHFHRPPLRRYQKGPMAKTGFYAVQCLRKHIRQKAKQREQERAASGGGDVFFMRKSSDLSAMDGILILSEYSEEYPLLLSQPGMATKVKNYYKRKPDKDSHCPRFRFGDTVFSHTSPFLGSLSPGHSLQAFENNMFRAPIYEHKMSPTDFLVIRTRHGYFVRHLPCIFTVGQQCPLMEVSGPNSKKATVHVRDFLQVFIYRLFSKSTDNPKRIKMEEIRKAFPTHSESSIRKRLKLCADFNRTGPDSNWWVIRRDFRLPTEEEMRAMVSTEQYCSHMSMIAAEQRLKDAGYGDKTMIVQAEDETGEDHQMKVDEEVLNAPWNTTRAYLSAVKGKCLLQVTGPADPTGCGEGFSYVKVPMKPQQPKDESAPAPPKKLVTGTDADLRRLSLTNAKNILRKYGVPDEEIRKLSRWEVIDVVRTMSTEQARAGATSKFARGTRFSVAEHQERYKEECQRVFDLQNRVLSSHDILSTDEDSSSGDDSDFEEMGKNIESILSNKKSSTQVSLEREEQERKELMKMISEGRNVDSGSQGRSSTPTQAAKKDGETSSIGSVGPGRCLKIYRKFKSEGGSEFVRVETVRKPDVIDAYLRIRNSKDEDFIRKFIMLDEQHREEMRREKRRIQEQLRRIKRNQEKDKLNQEKRKEKGLKPNNKQDTMKTSQMKCGACGQLGHMRTNRFCPMYNRSNALPDRPVALTEEQEEDMERAMFADSQNLIKVEGTKITLSKDLLKNVEAVRRKSLVLKFQKPETPQPVQRRKRKYQGSVSHCDYLTRPAKKKERKRADPVVTLSSLLENVLNGLRELPSTHPFHCPVNPRAVKDYYKIIEKPMDLQTMRDHLHKHSYLSRADFKEHLDLIVNNSKIYNGVDSPLTKTAIHMTDYCDSRFKDLEDKLMRLEKAINPLLDDDDQVSFSFVLDNIISNKMMTISDSWPFHNPVNKKIVPDYYKVVDHPMDLGTLKKNVQKHMYQNRGQFMEHVELILINSSKFNGAESKFTETARQIVDVCRNTLEEYDEHLTQLENDIAAAKKAAEEEAEAGADDDVVMDENSMDIGVDEDSNSSFTAMQQDDSKSNTMFTDMEDEKIDVESDVPTSSNDFVSVAAAQALGTQNDSNTADGIEAQEGKSLLLEDLLMSDGEMSASEDEEGNSEDEDEANPFARSESEGSDDDQMKERFQKYSTTVHQDEVIRDSAPDNAMDVPSDFRSKNKSSTKKQSLTLSSEGEDSEAGSFVSVGGEVVSESELSET